MCLLPILAYAQSPNFGNVEISNETHEPLRLKITLISSTPESQEVTTDNPRYTLQNLKIGNSYELSVEGVQTGLVYVYQRNLFVSDQEDPQRSLSQHHKITILESCQFIMNQASTDTWLVTDPAARVNRYSKASTADLSRMSDRLGCENKRREVNSEFKLLDQKKKPRALRNLWGIVGDKTIMTAMYSASTSKRKNGERAFRILVIKKSDAVFKKNLAIPSSHNNTCVHGYACRIFGVQSDKSYEVYLVGYSSNIIYAMETISGADLNMAKVFAYEIPTVKDLILEQLKFNGSKLSKVNLARKEETALKDGHLVGTGKFNTWLINIEEIEFNSACKLAHNARIGNEFSDPCEKDYPRKERAHRTRNKHSSDEK